MVSPAMVGVKFNPNAALFPLNGHRVRYSLNDRNRNLATRQKAGILTVVGDQVRLWQGSETDPCSEGPES